MGILAGSAGAATSGVDYLTELRHRFIFQYQGWGELGINTAAHVPWQEPLKLQINNKQYEKGLGHHAPGEIIVDLNGEYTTFEAEVGLQDLSVNAGSVVFEIYVDDDKVFDSGIMRGGAPAKAVSIAVEDAQELRLVVTDAGDSNICDCANWAEARLIRGSGAGTTRKPAPYILNTAQFAQVTTSNPQRMTGCKSSRVEEYLAEDILLEKDIRQEADGTYIVPMYDDGTGCIGLKWAEQRLLKKLGLEFTKGSVIPSADSVQLQCWIGESPYQGEWKPLKANIELNESKMSFDLDWGELPEAGSGSHKLRWIFAESEQPIIIERFYSKGFAFCGDIDLVFELEKPLENMTGEVEVYNGEIIGESGETLIARWDLSKPATFKVRYAKPRAWKSDKTVLRFRLPNAAFAIALDDIISEKAVYVRDAGLFVARKDAGITLADHLKKTAGTKTVLERVREMPDQTFDQAIEKTHNPVQNNGPMLLSLSCDNRKFIAHQDGAIDFRMPRNEPDAQDILESFFPCVMRPAFGSGEVKRVSRNLDGGWLPAIVMKFENNGVNYTQRAYVAQFDDEAPDNAPAWMRKRPVCVVEFDIENTTSTPADAALELAFFDDSRDWHPAEVCSITNGAVASTNDQTLAVVDSSDLSVDVTEGKSAIKGKLEAGTTARVVVLFPGWITTPEEAEALRGRTDLFDRMKSYWENTLAPAAKIDIPDQQLLNLILAQQVHCLIAGRNEDNGERTAAWIAALAYGPLESEAHSIIRGMDLLGHEEFARKSLDFFVRRYNASGLLTTGYTTMGTGWHLWTLGEHYRLWKNNEWMKSVAPEVARVCNWILSQKEKTKNIDSNNEKLPEYGLMPPGVMADWNAFAYYFCSNAYFYAGLQQAADALAAVDYSEAQKFLASADEFRQNILRSYEWTQSRMPVYPLQNGTWVPGYPSQLLCPGPTNDYFPGQDGNRSWCYDIELGAHQLIPAGVIDPISRAAREMMEHHEDVQFLQNGMGDYIEENNRADWFNLGGFAKVQPYYCRNGEIYMMQDEVKPFIRTYFNSIASLLNEETQWFWEHFHNIAAWDKTHETGYFLQHTRWMFITERGDELWLAPFVTNNWMRDGMQVSISNAPTRFGRVGYRITSHIDDGYIEAEIDASELADAKDIVIRLRHPEEKRMRNVSVNGKDWSGFDPEREIIKLEAMTGKIVVRAEF